MASKNRKLVWVVLGVLFFVNIVVWFVVYDLNKAREIEVIFFDVGQGDSIYIETSGTNQVLIDGGPSSAVLEKLGEEMPFYDRKIELMILTHPDHDHLAGLLEVLKSYKVENILWTGVVKNTQEWKKWKELIEKEEAKIKIAKKGQRIILKENPPVFLTILYPFKDLENKKVKNINGTAIVSRLDYGLNSFLFTADISKKVERELIKEGSNVSSDVLKVAHHGSKTSSCSEFLKEVSPSLAVIQVGENSYGHPYSEVLARLKEFGIQVQRTDEDGDIKIVSNGNSFCLKNEKY